MLTYIENMIYSKTIADDTVHQPTLLDYNACGHDFFHETKLIPSD